MKEYTALAPEEDNHQGFRHIWWTKSVQDAMLKYKHIKLDIKCPCPRESKNLVVFEDTYHTPGVACYGQIQCAECGRPAWVEALDVGNYEN